MLHTYSLQRLQVQLNDINDPENLQGRGGFLKTRALKLRKRGSFWNLEKISEIGVF